jgi:ribosomal protein S21
MINIEVQKNNNESATNLLKRFTKRVQGAGILNRVRSLRYSKRAESKYVRKKRTMKSLKRRARTPENGQNLAKLPNTILANVRDILTLK